MIYQIGFRASYYCDFWKFCLVCPYNILDGILLVTWGFLVLDLLEVICFVKKIQRELVAFYVDEKVQKWPLPSWFFFFFLSLSPLSFIAVPSWMNLKMLAKRWTLWEIHHMHVQCFLNPPFPLIRSKRLPININLDFHRISFAPNRWKWETQKTLVRRAYEACSSDYYLGCELQCLKKVFHEQRII